MDILLDFTKKDYSEAASFDDADLIHSFNMTKVLDLFSGFYDHSCEVLSAHNTKIDNKCNNTISIFASRGAGKTSFILTLIEKIKKRWPDALCLEPIDPSHIETKQHPFVNIIAAIQETVDTEINKKIEVSPLDHEYDELNAFKNSYSRLLKGLHVVNGIGEDNIYGSWNDDDYIALQGMDRAKNTNNLEKSFHDYLARALKLLGKRCLVITFDDIDTTYEKGFELLEIIRKYLATPFVIPILTGDQSLYTKLIRKQHWNFFDSDYIRKECDYSRKDKSEYVQLVNQLENQYMVKVLKPENRVTLYSIREYVIQNGYNIDVKIDENVTLPLEQCYIEMLTDLNAFSGSVGKMARFLMGLSLRVQIRILTLRYIVNSNKQIDSNTKKKYMVDGLMDIFSSDIYQVATNAKELIHGDNLYPTHLLSLLVSNKCLNSETNFMPETDNESLNKALFAVGIKMDHYLNMKYGKYLVFDLWLRICYTRFLVMKIGERKNDETLKDLLQYAKLSSDTGLIKAIGLSQAFLNGTPNIFSNEDLNIMPGTIYLGSSIPEVLVDKNQSLPVLPLIGTVNNLNEEKVMISVYRLFSVLSEFMIRVKFKPRENNDYYKSILKKLAQYRNFIEKVNGPGSAEEDRKDRNFEYSYIFTEEPLLEKVAFELKQWSYNGTFVSVQQLDRIFTRFYYTLIHIEDYGDYINVGDKFSAMLCALLNAALVEEALEKYVSEVNFSNHGNIEYVFLENLRVIKSRSDFKSKKIGTITSWLATCPLFKLYIDPLVYHLIMTKDEELFPIMAQVIAYGKTLDNQKVLERQLDIWDKLSKSHQNDIQALVKMRMLLQAKRNAEFERETLNQNKAKMEYDQFKKYNDDLTKRENTLDTALMTMTPVKYSSDYNEGYITPSSEPDELMDALQSFNAKKRECDDEINNLKLRIRKNTEKISNYSDAVIHLYEELNYELNSKNSVYPLLKQIPLSSYAADSFDVFAGQ